MNGVFFEEPREDYLFNVVKGMVENDRIMMGRVFGVEGDKVSRCSICEQYTHTDLLIWDSDYELNGVCQDCADNIRNNFNIEDIRPSHPDDPNRRIFG